MYVMCHLEGKYIYVILALILVVSPERMHFGKE